MQLLKRVEDLITYKPKPQATVIPQKLCELPPFSQTATALLALSNDPDVEIKAIAEVIQSDPAFASDVLYLANSPLLGMRSILHGVRQAVAVLGTERIKTLAYTAAMRGFAGDPAIPRLYECWQHSTACAVIAEVLAPFLDLSNDRSYTAGLMHDIGRLGLLKSYPAEYGPVLREEFDQMDDVLRAEKVALGVDHCEAGTWLVKAWRFPDSFENIAANHHAPMGESTSDLLYIVQLACILADRLGYRAVGCRSLPPCDSAVLELPPWLGNSFTWSAADLQAEIERRFKCFSGGGLVRLPQ